jgi:hypothetical protein
MPMGGRTELMSFAYSINGYILTMVWFASQIKFDKLKILRIFMFFKDTIEGLVLGVGELTDDLEPPIRGFEVR